MADELDRLIDAALAAPPAGVHLATRVLARVESAPQRGFWRWILPCAAASTAAVVVAIAVWPDPPLPPAPSQGVRVLRSIPLRLARPVPAAALAAQLRRSPRSATFPAPSPLSAEERALLRLAATPEAFAKPFTGDLIEIAPLEITPLAPAGGTN